jgi:hypothetical protein
MPLLRVSVLMLLLANSIYYAWAHGMLDPYGFGPPMLTEPQRLEQQIRPEALRITSTNGVSNAGNAATPKAAASAPAPAADASAPSPTAACLQAGVYDDAQAATLRRALEPALPPGAWVLEPAVVPGRWIVYMGRYPNAETVDRKKAELRALRVRFEAVAPTLEPGLSLGGFDSEAAANDELANLARRGIRTARVSQERAELRGSRLRLPAADDALKARMPEFSAALAGKPLKSCE